MTSPPDFADFAPTFRCPNGHTAPAGAGVCPRCRPSRRRRAVRGAAAAPGGGAVPALVQAFVDRFVELVDNGTAPRWDHAFGYEQHKIGVVNHIPVCDTLDQLTAYFNGGAAQGSTHFGVGRQQAGTLDHQGAQIPVAPVHQYMPILGPVAPWAQGLIQTSPTCRIAPSPTIKTMRPGEPNGAFVSIENVARTGAQGVTDPQFNANAFLRAYCAAFFGFAITPLTQLWHSEIDQACVTPEMRILTRDLLWIPAGDLRVGDKLIGFDDEPALGGTGRDRGRRAYRHAEVTATGIASRDVFEIVTDSGTRLSATPEHRWLIRRGKAPSGVIEWVRTDELYERQHHNRFGSRLPRFFRAWDVASDYPGGYLAGAFDGEGCLFGQGRAPVLAFSQRRNAMMDHVARFLELDGVKYHQSCAASRPAARSNVVGEIGKIEVQGYLPEVLRFVGMFRPPRLIERWEDISIHGRMMRAPQEWDERIVSVRPVGKRSIVTLSSSTGTYFAEGFGAHNTRCNDPGWDGDLEDAMQEAARRLLAGDVGGLRGVQAPPPPPPPPADYRARYIAELHGELAAARDDALRAALREQTARDKLVAEGETP